MPATVTVLPVVERDVRERSFSEQSIPESRPTPKQIQAKETTQQEQTRPRWQAPKQHAFFEQRPSWDSSGLTLFTQTDANGTDKVIAARGLVLPNKINLRQKTHGHLFPIELGGTTVPLNALKDWHGPNYAIPLRALSARVMAQQATFNHSGWDRRRVPKEGLMACIKVIRNADGHISHLHILAWTISISTGAACSTKPAAEWEIPNRFPTKPL
jgi:hypothetical protein